jgi:Raf kinase inhibitor-like YbhB/YbcL family protein
MRITSSTFGNNWRIPSKYTCDGMSVNPPLSFSEVPANAKSLALVVCDIDAPAEVFIHWILMNIDPKVNEIKENSVPESAMQGKTSAKIMGYIAACPPSGTHHYYFKLFALDTILNLTNPDIIELEAAMKGHIIEQAELIGLYSRD